MGRLIDADNLQFNRRNYNKSQMKAILDFIDAQPTPTTWTRLWSSWKI